MITMKAARKEHRREMIVEEFEDIKYKDGVIKRVRVARYVLPDYVSFRPWSRKQYKAEEVAGKLKGIICA